MAWKRALDRGVEVGVGKDDVRALAAELERDPLERLAALGADLAADRGRAGERDLVDARVVDQRGAGLAVAGEDVEHAGREAGLERELAEAQRGQRRLLGGLEDQRAAGGEGRGDLPDRHQQREVPGHDLSADADRLAQRVDEEVAARDRDRLALDLGRPAGVVAQVGDRAGDVAAGGGERLAVVERLDLGELVAVCLDQLGERVDHPGALGGRELSHRPVERGAGGLGGAADVVGAGVGDLADRLAGRRVDRLEGAAVGGVDPLAADQQPVRRIDELAGGVGQRVGCGGRHAADRNGAFDARSSAAGGWSPRRAAVRPTSRRRRPMRPLRRRPACRPLPGSTSAGPVVPVGGAGVVVSGAGAVGSGSGVVGVVGAGSQVGSSAAPVSTEASPSALPELVAAVGGAGLSVVGAVGRDARLGLAGLRRRDAGRDHLGLAVGVLGRVDRRAVGGDLHGVCAGADVGDPGGGAAGADAAEVGHRAVGAGDRRRVAGRVRQ